MSNEEKKRLQELYLQELGAIPTAHEQWLASLTKEQRVRIQASTNRWKHGLHAVAPLTCQGPRLCPFLTSCPIPESTTNWGPESNYPIGLQCVLEAEFMVQRIAEYMIHLDVSPNNPIEVSIVNELALLDLQKNRALAVLSGGDKEGQGRDFMHVDESVTGYTEGGTPLVSKTTKIHPVWELLNALERRREKWHEKLMETRKARAEHALKTGEAQVGSKVLVEIEGLKKFVGELVSGTKVLQIDTTADEGIELDEDPWQNEE